MKKFILSVKFLLSALVLSIPVLFASGQFKYREAKAHYIYLKAPEIIFTSKDVSKLSWMDVNNGQRDVQRWARLRYKCNYNSFKCVRYEEKQDAGSFIKGAKNYYIQKFSDNFSQISRKKGFVVKGVLFIYMFLTILSLHFMLSLLFSKRKPDDQKI